MSPFKPAVKYESKLRLALVGPAGSGKTYTALLIAERLANGGKIALIDTEHGSASKYADKWGFDTLMLESFDPHNYIAAIEEAERGGYAVLIIDSLSHAWAGKDGALEMVDRAATRNRGNKFAGWRDVTPLHNRLIDTMLGSKLHLIATMRSKTEWLLEDTDEGKKKPVKIGLQPQQREGMEYEFDVVGDIDWEHNLIISKSRCEALADKVFKRPGAEIADMLLGWLSGEPKPPEPAHSTTPDFNAPADRQVPTEYQQAQRAGKKTLGADGLPKPEEMKTIGDVLGAAWKHLRLGRPEALRQLGVGSTDDIHDFPAAWRILTAEPPAEPEPAAAQAPAQAALIEPPA